MTLSQFSMHRPGLFASLARIIAEAQYDGRPWAEEWTVIPQYDGGIRFVAQCGDLRLLLCVAPSHPMAMPGDEGTWVWAEDLR